MSSSNSICKNTGMLLEIEDDSWEETNRRDIRSCYCEINCPLRTSWTRSNSGWCFWICPKLKTEKCTFFKWKDPPHTCWENEGLKLESLSWIKARSVDKINRIIIGVYSSSIGDEHGVFTYLIPFYIDWDIQV